MTSKLTREQLHERARENVKALKMASRQTAFESAREEILADLQLAELALAAMDSEPVAWTWHYREQWYVTSDKCRAEFVATDGDVAVLPLYRHAQPAPTCESITVTDDMAYAFHHALTDSMIGADDVEEIKTGLRAVFANLTAPVVSAEYPDRLPCSVLLEPGLRFGKGIKTSTMLAALARRAVHESDMAALSPEERVEFQARIEEFKALIAQPAPAVPEEITIETATIIAYGLPTTNIGAIFKAGHDACRAARLKAQPQNAPQNIPEIIPGWIPVSEQKPDCWCLTCRPVVLNDMRFVVCPDCGNKRCPRANDHRNACTGSNEPGQEGSAYPDTPREVKP
nr:MAG TPA: hydrogenase/urease nickel incorporation protein [Caudoviricetes sp.]